MTKPERRTAIVTGGGGGIGSAIVRRLVDDGHSVLIVDRDTDRATAIEEDARAAGGDVASLILDLASREAPAEIVEACMHRFGRLEILINNAGYTILKPIVDTTDDEWDGMLSGMLTPTFALSRAAVTPMREVSFGRIVNMSSAAGLHGLTRRGAYGTIKGAIAQFTRALAVETGASEITVNAVAPGPIETPLVAGHSEVERNAWVSHLAIPRYGQPSEVAAAVSFLASRDAGFFTGQVLSIDGGFSAGARIEG